MKVMVADDDASVRQSLCKVLEQANYDVVLAADGHEALDQLGKEEVDLLLLDIGMPIKNGWDTFERIMHQNPALPLIVITGQTQQYKTASAAGVGALIEKPFEAIQLLQTIRELLSESKEDRLRRVCSYNRNERHIPASSSAHFLRELRERYSAPRPWQPLVSLQTL